MRLLRRRALPLPRRTRPAARYLAAGAEEARRLGASYIGTEHVPLALTRDPESSAARMLRQLGVAHEDVTDSAFLARVWAPRIDPDALVALGIDLEAVRERLEETQRQQRWCLRSSASATAAKSFATSRESQSDPPLVSLSPETDELDVPGPHGEARRRQ